MSIRSLSHGRTGRAGLVALLAASVSCTLLVPSNEAPASDGIHPRTEQAVPLHEQVNDALSVGQSTLLSLDLDRTPAQPVTTVIEHNDEIWTLELNPFSVRAPGYRVLADRGHGVMEELDPSPERTLRGEVLEVPGSRVAATMTDAGLEAMIVMPEPFGRWWIEPVAGAVAGADPDLHVIFHDDDVLSDHGGTCAVHETRAQLGDSGDPSATPGSPLEDATGSAGTAQGTDGCVYFTEIAFDVDWQYFDGPGNNNEVFVETRVLTVINSVGVQYETEVDIRFVTTTIIIRTNPSDPYSETTNGSALLTEFANHWNTVQSGVQRDLAQLFTGRDISGSVIGIALPSSICTPNGYSVVENINPSSCRNDLSSHEIGHNWAAGHCSCPGFTMNPSLTCANQFTTATENSIIAHRNSRPCLDVVCPPDNEDCATALAVVPGVATPFSTIFATLDGPVENACFQLANSQIASDAWFRFTAPCEGPITVSICDADFNSRMAIYEANCPAGDDEAIACNDDACGTASEITFNALENVDYLIRIGSSSNSVQGVGTLMVTPGETCISTPTNDTCAVSVTRTEGLSTFSTLGANTDGFEEPQCGFAGSDQIENDVWYRHLVQCDGNLTVSLCGSAFDTRLAVYDLFCPGGPNEAIACDDNSCDDQSEVTIPVTAGQLVRIRIGSTGGVVGAGQLTITCNLGVPCSGDTNADNVVDVTDLVNVILDWDTDGSGNGGDVNTDGIVNVNDLLEVILAWGACP